MQGKVELIKFEKQDALFLQEIFSYAFRDSSIENLEKIIEGWKNSFCYGIVYNDEKVGFITLGKKMEGKLGFGVAIKEDCRGKGIASKAFELAKEMAKKQGYEWIISSCSVDNIASKGLHEKLGFKLIKEEINQAGNKMLRWELEI